MSLSDKIFGNYTRNNQRRIRNMVKEVKRTINYYKKKGISKEEINKRSRTLMAAIRSGKTTVEDNIIEATALCYLAAEQALNISFYDVQIEAALAMREGTIAEVKTGEGKTYIQIIEAYLNALDGKGVHVITANDYLIGRDLKETQPVYDLLGLSSSVVYGNERMTRDERRERYKCDIVYGTAKTLAFDYLLDNTATKKEDRVFNPEGKNDSNYGKSFNYAIIDEADSILLDDATIPLIISGSYPGQRKADIGEEEFKRRNNLNREMYRKAMRLADTLTCKIENQDQLGKDKDIRFSEDCLLYLDDQRVIFSEKLYKKIYGNIDVSKLSIEEQENYMNYVIAVENCILAKYYYKKGEHYILSSVPVKPNKKPRKEIVLIDESTGRLTPGRRRGRGLHEALEAKEEMLAEGKGYHVAIQAPTVTTATCTYPDFISKYKSGVSGMTGTSNIEEFNEIYNLPTYEVPSRLPNIRRDLKNSVYLTKKAKYKAIINEVLKAQETLQPVLIGTTSVEESEMISKLLAEEGIRHQLLNAVNNEYEDEIIESAGMKGRVTVATNMAGRGSNIKLGEGVKELGGLYVIGTSRNNNERIDYQLRGRASRQGEPGKTKYFSSLEDELVKTRAYEKLFDLARKLTKSPNKEIEDSNIVKYVDRCQKTQEGLESKARRMSEKYGKVMTKQKDLMYAQRDVILDSTDVRSLFNKIIPSYADYLVNNCTAEEIRQNLNGLVNVKIPETRNLKPFKEAIERELLKKVKINLTTRESIDITKRNMLNVVDTYWINHLERLEDLKKQTSYYSLSGVDPFKEYEKVANQEFVDLNPRIQRDFLIYATNPTLQFGKAEAYEMEGAKSL